MSSNKKLYKIKSKGKLCGVCAGLAEYFDADVTLIRLLWILITVVTAIGTGIVAYIACAIIMPEKSDLLDDL